MLVIEFAQIKNTIGGAMGSKGSGRFSDYSGAQKDASGAGGASGTDRCQQAFTCTLEDVAQCDYYTQNDGVPPVGTVVNVVHDGRIFVVDAASGLKVGALPTAFNYLAACIRSGVNYTGVVSYSANTSVPTVTVDFTPI